MGQIDGGRLRTKGVRVLLEPKPKGNAQRIVKIKGQPKIVNDKAVLRRQRELTKALRYAAPASPFGGAVLVDVVFYLPVPTSWPQWKQRAAERGLVLPYTEKEGSSGGIPDRGNMLKLLEDCLEKAAWLSNDSQVVGGAVEKRYGKVACYEVRVSEVNEVATYHEWKGLLASEALGEGSGNGS